MTHLMRNILYNKVVVA